MPKLKPGHVSPTPDEDYEINVAVAADLELVGMQGEPGLEPERIEDAQQLVGLVRTG